MNQAIGNSKERILTPYNMLLVVAFCYDTLFNFATVVLKRLPIIGLVGDYVMPAVVVVLVLLNFAVYRTMAAHAYDFMITMLILFMLCVSYLIFPATQEYYNQHNMDLVFMKAVPFLFIGSNFRANQTTVKLLTWVSYLALAVNTAYIFYFMSSRDASNYNMHYAYLMLPHVMFIIYGLFNKELKLPAIFKICFFVLGAVFIMAMGTRGPILIMLVYLIVAIWKTVASFSTRKAFWAVVFIGIVAVYVFNSYLALAEALRDFIGNMGLSTRALDIFLEGEYISSTSGRNEIYDLLWTKICEAPMGYGLFGEWQFVNYSAHNIYLQLCMYFGLIPGTSLAAILLFVFAQGYFCVKNRYAKDIILLFFVLVLVRGFFGGEFFSEHVFFMIGFSLRCICEKDIINDLGCAGA